VTLSIALRREPTSLFAEEWQKERQSAIKILESIKDRDTGDIVQQAILVLRVLQGSRSPQELTSDALDTASISRQQLDLFGHMEYNTLHIPPPASSSTASTMPIWSTPFEHSVAGITASDSAPTSTLPNDMLRSLSMSMEWAPDSGTINSFDLLHGLDK